MQFPNSGRRLSEPAAVGRVSGREINWRFRDLITESVLIRKQWKYYTTMGTRVCIKTKINKIKFNDSVVNSLVWFRGTLRLITTARCDAKHSTVSETERCDTSEQENKQKASHMDANGTRIGFHFQPLRYKKTVICKSQKGALLEQGHVDNMDLTNLQRGGGPLRARCCFSAQMCARSRSACFAYSC